MAHKEGNLNSFAVILGNAVAVKAYRAGKLPYPDGTITGAQFALIEDAPDTSGLHMLGPPAGLASSCQG